MQYNKNHPNVGEIWWADNNSLYGGEGLRPVKILKVNEEKEECVVSSYTHSSFNSDVVQDVSLAEEKKGLRYTNRYKTYKIKFKSLSHEF